MNPYKIILIYNNKKTIRSKDIKYEHSCLKCFREFKTGIIFNIFIRNLIRHYSKYHPQITLETIYNSLAENYPKEIVSAKLRHAMKNPKDF